MVSGKALLDKQLVADQHIYPGRHTYKVAKYASTAYKDGQYRSKKLFRDLKGWYKQNWQITGKV